jgi:asparaginyl-tRNA synthetase
VSGQLNVEAYYLTLTRCTPSVRLPRREFEHQPLPTEFWMIEPEIGFADLSDNAALAEGLLKYTSRRYLTKDRKISPSSTCRDYGDGLR